MSSRYDLLILGGGASGLAAAVTAASLGVVRIAVIEKLPRVGKKILATGNGRCNLSHEGITAGDYRGSVEVSQILEQFGDVKTFFENLGLYTRTDDAGRMYPYTMTAAAVLDAFRLRMREDGVEEICGTEVTGLRRKNGIWHVETTGVEYLAPHVIFSAGGHAAPKLGTDGSAWGLLKALGIPMTAPAPNLCPVLSNARMLRPLKGLRVKGEITLWDKDRAVRTESGEVQFTEKALSGICVFNLSGLIDTRRISGYSLVFDPVPELGNGLTDILYTLQGTRCGMTCEEMLSGLLPKPLLRLILKNAAVSPELSSERLDGRMLRQLAAAIRRVKFPVQGLADFTQAQATRGGVCGNALDAHLQVKAYPGLYVTGEAVDVHADCGGYHLHWCWASGAAAASAVAVKCSEKGKRT